MKTPFRYEKSKDREHTYDIFDCNGLLLGRYESCEPDSFAIQYMVRPFKMAYVAIDSFAADCACYAIHDADPALMEGFDETLAKWKSDGAIIKLLPMDEAKMFLMK